MEPAIQYETITGKTGQVLAGDDAEHLEEYPVSSFDFGARRNCIDMPTIASAPFEDPYPGKKSGHFRIRGYARTDYNLYLLGSISPNIGKYLFIRFIGDDGTLGECPNAYIESWVYGDESDGLLELTITGRGGWRFTNMAGLPG